MRYWPLFCVTGFTLSIVTDADALCIYGGKHFEKSAQAEWDGRLYAKTTLADEFMDSSLVVRGTVLSSTNVSEVPHDENSELGDTYRVRVEEVFKGSAPKIITDFTEQNSGGFYLDNGVEYLLFLDPLDRTHWGAKIAPGAMAVNYECGQSRPWAKVSEQDKIELTALSYHLPKHSAK